MFTAWKDKIILVLLGAGLLSLSWHKWVNISVDYGRELYVPWRITCGQVLYRDMASLFGPFPPYWNALLFKVFGVSLTTLVLFNIFLVACFSVLIYRFFSYTVDRRIALFASVGFLSILAFSQNRVLWNQGDFAYICPYSYSVTYALFFSLWTMDMLLWHNKSGKDTIGAAVGALIGLTALCRFEIFISLGVAVIFGLMARSIIERWPLDRLLRAGGWVLAGFLVPVGLVYFYFSTQLPHPQVVISIFGFNPHWREILTSKYYGIMFGLDHPWPHFVIMLITAAGYGVALIAFQCLCMGQDFFYKNRRWQGIFFILLGAGGVMQLAYWMIKCPPDDIFKGLPVVIICMLIYLTCMLVRHHQEKDRVKRLLPLWVMTAWGVLMLTKVFLNVQLNAEGFVYLMPAVILFVAFFQGFIPSFFVRMYPKAYFIQPLATALVVFICMIELIPTIQAYQARHFYIRSRGDFLIVDELASRGIQDTAAFLNNADKIMDKKATFAAFPEGIMLNFLTKKVDPIPYITFRPAEMVRYGEQRMLNALKQHSPDYIIMNKQWFDSVEPSMHYPRMIKAWILTHYYPIWPAYPGADDMLTVLKRTP